MRRSGRPGTTIKLNNGTSPGVYRRQQQMSPGPRANVAALFALALAAGASGTWVTISDLEFTKCGGPLQGFEVENLAGTGKIRDTATGEHGCQEPESPPRPPPPAAAAA
eukprot:SAG22_NODE_560_length_9102_cov_54.310785_7_plen_109_part_00